MNTAVAFVDISEAGLKSTGQRFRVVNHVAEGRIVGLRVVRGSSKQVQLLSARRAWNSLQSQENAQREKECIKSRHQHVCCSLCTECVNRATGLGLDMTLA